MSGPQVDMREGRAEQMQEKLSGAIARSDVLTERLMDGLALVLALMCSQRGLC